LRQFFSSGHCAKGFVFLLILALVLGAGKQPRPMILCVLRPREILRRPLLLLPASPL
jgi:hypothetical protein